MALDSADQPTKRKKVLILKVGAFGDICFALPIVSALQNEFPGIQIDWLTDNGFVNFLAEFKGIRNISSTNTKDLYSPNLLKRVFAVLRIRRATRGYDAIFTLHRATSYIALTAGRKNVFQIIRDKNWIVSFFATTLLVPILSIHESLAFKRLVELWVGRKISIKNWIIPELKTPASPSADKTIALHVGGGSNTKTKFDLKKWPHFPALISEILKSPDLSDFKILLLGTKQDREQLGALPSSDRIDDQTGKTSLAELPQLFRRIDIFVGPDSGLLHLFDHASVPSIGLYGPTSDVSWGVIGTHSQSISLNVECSPCYKDDGVFPECHNHHRCMINLSVKRVLDQVMTAAPNPLK